MQKFTTDGKFFIYENGSDMFVESGDIEVSMMSDGERGFDCVASLTSFDLAQRKFSMPSSVVDICGSKNTIAKVAVSIAQKRLENIDVQIKNLVKEVFAN